MEAALNDDVFEKARKAYEEGWVSSRDTSDYDYSTWAQLHTAHWDGQRSPSSEVLPLTPIHIHIIPLGVGRVSLGEELFGRGEDEEC